MSDPLTPDLLPFANAEERQLLRARVLSAQDEQDLLAEIKGRRDSSLSKPETSAAQNSLGSSTPPPDKSVSALNAIFEGESDEVTLSPIELPEEPKDFAESYMPFYPQGKTIRQKLSDMADSNLFWSGGVGMALVALAFRWANAPPKFTITLLSLAWVILSVSVYRHGFFENKSWAVAALCNAGISVGIVLVFVVTWFILRPSIGTPSFAQSTPTPTIDSRPGPIFLSPSPVASVPLIASPTPTLSRTPANRGPRISPSPKNEGIIRDEATNTLVLPEGSTFSDPRMGYIAGVVRSNTDDPLADASIEIENIKTKQRYQADSDDNGYFKRQVPLGEYKVTILRAGYHTVSGHCYVTKKEGCYVDLGRLRKE